MNVFGYPLIAIAFCLGVLSLAWLVLAISTREFNANLAGAFMTSAKVNFAVAVAAFAAGIAVLQGG